MEIQRMAIRKDTAANWASTNPILADGEWAKETDTGKTKLGDGTTDWNSLEYYGGGGISPEMGNNGDILMKLGGEWTAVPFNELFDIHTGEVINLADWEWTENADGEIIITGYTGDTGDTGDTGGGE
jgi:hypothetical protein